MSFYVIFHFEVNLGLSPMREQSNETSMNQHVSLHCYIKNSYTLTCNLLFKFVIFTCK